MWACSGYAGGMAGYESGVRRVSPWRANAVLLGKGMPGGTSALSGRGRVCKAGRVAGKGT